MARSDRDNVGRWLDETLRYGMSCSVVEGRRAIGRHGVFEDSCVKTQLRLTQTTFRVDSGSLAVDLKELTAAESNSRRPTSPVFRLAEADVPSRLVTLRWNQTGRQLQTRQHAYLLFSTSADARAFSTGMEEVQRFGVRAVLAGRRRGSEAEEPAEPSLWQIEAGKERFTRALRKWRGQQGFFGLQSGDTSPSTGAVEEEGNCAATVPDITSLMSWEDGEMYERWITTLGGRGAEELSATELQPLIDSGMPLKYRHELWPRWFEKQGLESVADLEGRVTEGESKQIDLDVPRTSPTLLDDTARAEMRRVLCAYAARNPGVGYCQGMNFLVMIFLVLGFSMEAAFTALCFLVEDICPGYHRLGLEGYVRDVAVLGVLVQHLQPAVHQQLEAFDVPLTCLALDHFMSLGSRVFPFGATVRFWDLLLSQGSAALFASFLALLQLYMPGAAATAQEGGAPGVAGARSPGGAGATTAPAGSGEELSAADVMDRFKRAVQLGATTNMEQIVRRTRMWLSRVPIKLIERLRCEIVTEGVCG